MSEAIVVNPKSAPGISAESAWAASTDQARRTDTSKREIELDFIRGLAILMVVDFHSPARVLSYPFKLLGFQPFGWMGVDIFFVLSGFLVGGLLIREWKVRGRIDAKRFLIRRGFKIWPSYYMYLALMLVTRHRTLSELSGNLLNIQNYTGGIPHTWTLALEEHAYILLTLCLGIASWWRARVRNLFLFLVVVSAGSSVLRMIQMTRPKGSFDPYIATQTRIDGILYGVMLAIVFQYAPDAFRRIQDWWWLWIATLAGTLVYFRLDLHGGLFASWSVDAANFSGIALLMLLYRPHERRDKSKAYRFVALIGMYSYGIYLWHVSMVAPVLAIQSRFPSWLAPVWGCLAPTVAGVIAGIVLSKLVEFPALKLRNRIFPGRIDSAVVVPVPR